jgi:hypothetical protein
MKLVQITFRFEFSDDIEEILDNHGIADFVRTPFVDSRDRDGKHFGTKIFPGSGTLVQALVEEDAVVPLLEDLRGFREKRESHRHLRALVLPVEDFL